MDSAYVVIDVFLYFLRRGFLSKHRSSWYSV